MGEIGRWTPVLRMLEPSALTDLLEVRRGVLRIGRDPMCDIRLDDEACSRFHARLMIRGSPSGSRGPRAVVEDLGSASGTWVNKERITRPRVLRRRDRVRIGETLYAYHLLDELELRALRTMVKAALTDALTGLQNRHSFEQDLARELHRARRYGWPLTLLLVDVDHFKRVNDAFGHAAGDRVLQAVARVLGEDKRAFDLAGRHGGEEFVVALPQTDGESGAAAAERLRASIEALRIDEGLRVTVSVGVAVTDGGEVDIATLFAVADAALYRAKAAGRNRVVRLGAGGEDLGAR